MRVNLEARVIFTDHIFRAIRAQQPEITLDEVMLVSYQAWMNLDISNKRKFQKTACVYIEDLKKGKDTTGVPKQKPVDPSVGQAILQKQKAQE